MKIGSFEITKESKVFIIAELSANHNGSIKTAIETVRAAKRSGADCIKLQTYTPDTLTIDCNKEDFVIPSGSIWGRTKFLSIIQKSIYPMGMA